MRRFIDTGDGCYVNLDHVWTVTPSFDRTCALKDSNDNSLGIVAEEEIDDSDDTILPNTNPALSALEFWIDDKTQNIVSYASAIIGWRIRAGVDPIPITAGGLGKDWCIVDTTGIPAHYTFSDNCTCETLEQAHGEVRHNAKAREELARTRAASKPKG